MTKKKPDTEPSPAPCAICGALEATVGKKPINALPEGVPACAECREAIRQRQVGVTRNEDGTLNITDGRAPAEPIAPSDVTEVELVGHVADSPDDCAAEYGPGGGLPAFCTLKRGHEGPHEAHTGEGTIAATWTDPIDIRDAYRQAGQSVSIVLVEEDWSRLMGLLQSVEESAAEHEDCKKAASDAKKSHEAAQDALQRALARMRDGLSATNNPTLPFGEQFEAAGQGSDSDGLPFGGVHQSDVVQAAHDDPTIVTLCERLVGVGWDVTPLVVAGWPQTERDQVTAWLDGFADRPPLADGQPGPAPADIEFAAEQPEIDRQSDR